MNSAISAHGPCPSLDQQHANCATYTEDVHASMPALCSHHVAVFNRAIFQCPNKITVSTCSIISPCPARPTRCTSRRHVDTAINRRWIISRTGLQSDRRVRVQMISNSLQRLRYTTLLLIHGRRSLPASTSSGLCVQICLVLSSLHLRTRCLHYIHGCVPWSSSWIGWRSI